MVWAGGRAEVLIVVRVKEDVGGAGVDGVVL